MAEVAINLGLHPKQQVALDSPANEILYGGAAGGGKSHLMRVASILWCSQIAGLQVYLFRRYYVDLKGNHMEGPTGYRALLANWTNAGLCKIVEDEVRFWNGSKIYLCHLADDNALNQYQGREIHVLLIDELTHFTEGQYRFLRGRNRATGIDVPDHLKGQFPRILAGSNPGSIGHEWVKRFWIDDKEPLELYQMDRKTEGGKLRQFIPALLEDNSTLTKENPDYEYSLLGLGSPALVEAMRYGNWNIQAGSFFPEFGTAHLLDPIELPSWWMRFRSFDWGSSKPFHVGWYAVSDGTIQSIPRNAIIMYREWYGAKGINEGLRYTVEQVAEGIKTRDLGEKFTYSVADTAIFTSDGGPSMAERFHVQKINWQRADKSRVTGWDQIRQRLRPNEDGLPMIYFFKTCKDTIRTLPLMTHDEKKAEDIDTRLEDHAADSLRYACMSRPYIASKPPGKAKLKGIESLSIDELYKLADNNKL